MLSHLVVMVLVENKKLALRFPIVAFYSNIECMAPGVLVTVVLL